MSQPNESEWDFCTCLSAFGLCLSSIVRVSGPLKAFLCPSSLSVGVRHTVNVCCGKRAFFKGSLSERGERGKEIVMFREGRN